MKIIDLTHTLTGDIPVYPGDPPPRLTPCATIEERGFRQLSIEIGSHTGTHVDAPAHLLPGGITLDMYPLEAFIGPALVLDCRLSEEQMRLALRIQSARRAQFVFFRTGHGALWGRPEYSTPWPTPPESILRLLVSRGIKGVGVDAMSVDPAGDSDLPNHRLLMEAGLLIFENLARLELLPMGIFTFVGTPLRLPRADGAPVRALGIAKELWDD